MNFDIDYDKQPLKFLKKQNKDLIRRIMGKIDALLMIRILYRINYKTRKVIIFKIDKRSKVYN